MWKLRRRDWEMNSENYKAASEEMKKILRNKVWKCPKCGGKKKPHFTLCYECNKKRKDKLSTDDTSCGKSIA